jgi:hypothetical protein
MDAIRITHPFRVQWIRRMTIRSCIRCYYREAGPGAASPTVGDVGNIGDKPRRTGSGAVKSLHWRGGKNPGSGTEA